MRQSSIIKFPLALLLGVLWTVAVRADAFLGGWATVNPQPYFIAPVIQFAGGRFFVDGSHSTTDGNRWLDVSTDPYRFSGPFAYANGTFAVVKFNFATTKGEIYTSSDGEKWDFHYIDRDLGSQLLAAGNGVFVFTGMETSGAETINHIFTSKNAVDWTHQASPGSEIFTHLIFANGMFLAAGNKGGIYTSSSGAGWDKRASGINVPLIGICYGNGLFLAITTTGDVLTSPDTVNWTRSNVLTYGELSPPVFGKGMFLTVGNGTVLISSDGTSWTPRYVPEVQLCKSVAFGNGQFMAVGTDDYSFSGLGQRSLATSSDGTNWISRLDRTTANLRAVISTGGLLTAVGMKGTVLTSSDGHDWNAQTSGTTNGLWEIVHGQGKYVAVGDSGTVITSTNGSNWQVQTSGTTAALRGVTYGQDKFVAVGDLGTIITSADAVNWQPQTNLSQTRLHAIAYGGGRYVAVGRNYTIVSSNDGEHWITNAVPREVNYHLFTVAWGNGQFVAGGGRDEAEPANIVQKSVFFNSVDGVRWFSHSEPGRTVRRVSFDDGSFYCIREHIHESPDGTLWLDWGAPYAQSSRGLCVHNHRIYAAGDYGMISRIGTRLRFIPYATQASETGMEPATFAIERRGDSSQPLTVRLYPVGGTADPSELRISELLVEMAAGQTIASVSVTAVADHKVEGTENIVLWVAGGEYLLPQFADMLSISILDEATTPRFRVHPLRRDPDGTMHLDVDAPPGMNYIVEASNDLLTWTPISADISTPFVQLTDPDSKNFPNRFYRARVTKP